MSIRAEEASVVLQMIVRAVLLLCFVKMTNNIM